MTMVSPSANTTSFWGGVSVWQTFISTVTVLSVAVIFSPFGPLYTRSPLCMPSQLPTNSHSWVSSLYFFSS